MVRLQKTAEANTATELVRTVIGADVSQENPNAREELARVLGAAGPSVFSSHADGFSGEFVRLASINDITNAWVVLTAWNIKDSQIDMSLASKPIGMQNLFADSGNYLESALMRLNGAIISLDVNYRHLISNAPEPVRRSLESAFAECNLWELPRELRNIELQYQHIMTPELSNRFSLLTGNVLFTQEMVARGKPWEEIVPIFSCDTMREFLEEASKHLDAYTLNKIVQVMDYIASDTSTGTEVERLTQEVIARMIEEVRAIAEELEFSKKLREDLDKVIEEENEKKEEEKYSSIAEAIPEQFLATVGLSEDSKTLAEMLSGVREYDSSVVKEILVSNPELAENVARFFTEA